ncbi:MAG: RNB domain-containing ribonuclease [Desulforhopalus sp.]|nr:RNB domain-containing ribonuclease [Desulforhopalus sp.]
MIVAGKLIEYLDNGKFVCALVVESQLKRLRLINQNGRELNLPVSRVIHCSNQTHPISENRELLTKQLREAFEKRCSLMNNVNLREVWEVISEDGPHSFTPAFLAELTFGEIANDDSISALLRCVFEDKLFFKYKEGLILANQPEKVEQLQTQLNKEAKRQQLIEKGAEFFTALFTSNSAPEKLGELEEETLKIIRDYYLFGNEATEADLAQKLLKTAGLTKPHDPFHLLVKAGIWSVNENIALLRQELPVNFSLAARQQAELILQRGQEELFDDPGRTDLTYLSPITIDGPTTLDFDDALTVVEQDGNYLVGIHISDVAHYVRPGDPLFFEAMHRGTSIYFPEGQIPMLPRHLSQGICSLIQDETRAALSFMILLSADAEILKVRIFPSIIKVKRRLTYDEVDRMLDTDKEIRLLDMLRRKLRSRRLKKGALLLPFPDVNIFVDHQGKVHVNLSKSDTPARTIVSEMMILANSEAAKYVADRMVPGLFRSQPVLQNRIVFGEDDDLFQNTLQRKNIPRGELSTTAKSHSGLGVSHYTTVTSPIRRLLDLVMQHQLNSIIRRKEPCFTEEMCKDFNSVLTRTLTAAQIVRQQRQRYWLLKYLADRQGQYVDALVIQTNPKRINLLLTDILMDIDLPPPGGKAVSPNMCVKVLIVKSDPLDNVLRLDW